MKRNTILLVVLLGAFGYLAQTNLACGAGADEKGAKAKTNLASIAPGELLEICMALTPRDQLRYSFTGSGELSFSIHYHAGDKVVFPIAERVVTGEKDSFTPPSEQDYCLMWSNPGAKAVELRLEYETRAGAK